VLRDQFFSLPNDAGELTKTVMDNGARLVIIDPLAAALGPGINANHDQDVRRALAPLAKLAEETGVAVVMVRHLRKGDAANALGAGLGSIGITGAARTLLTVNRHPGDTDGSLRVLAVAKCNVARLAESRVFRLQAAGGHSKVVWEGTCNYSAEDLNARRAAESSQRAKGEAAKDFVHESLANGPLRKRDVVDRGAAEGLTARTIERAAKSLGVLTTREAFGGQATWQLPSSPGASISATLTDIGENGGFGEDARVGTAA
jgi:hypothetical protein